MFFNPRMSGMSGVGFRRGMVKEYHGALIQLSHRCDSGSRNPLTFFGEPGKLRSHQLGMTTQAPTAGGKLISGLAARHFFPWNKSWS